MTTEDHLANSTLQARRHLREMIADILIITVAIVVGLTIDTPWLAWSYGLGGGLVVFAFLHHWSEWRWQRQLARLARQAIAERQQHAAAQIWDAGWTDGNHHNGRRDHNPYRTQEDQ